MSRKSFPNNKRQQEQQSDRSFSNKSPNWSFDSQLLYDPQDLVNMKSKQIGSNYIIRRNSDQYNPLDSSMQSLDTQGQQYRKCLLLAFGSQPAPKNDASQQEKKEDKKLNNDNKNRLIQPDFSKSKQSYKSYGKQRDLDLSISFDTQEEYFSSSQKKQTQKEGIQTKSKLISRNSRQILKNQDQKIIKNNQKISVKRQSQNIRKSQENRKKSQENRKRQEENRIQSGNRRQSENRRQSGNRRRQSNNTKSFRDGQRHHKQQPQVQKRQGRYSGKIIFPIQSKKVENKKVQRNSLSHKELIPNKSQLSNKSPHRKDDINNQQKENKQIIYKSQRKRQPVNYHQDYFPRVNISRRKSSKKLRNTKQYNKKKSIQKENSRPQEAETDYYDPRISLQKSKSKSTSKVNNQADPGRNVFNKIHRNRPLNNQKYKNNQQTQQNLSNLPRYNNKISIQKQQKRSNNTYYNPKISIQKQEKRSNNKYYNPKISIQKQEKIQNTKSTSQKRNNSIQSNKLVNKLPQKKPQKDKFNNIPRQLRQLNPSKSKKQTIHLRQSKSGRKLRSSSNQSQKYKQSKRPVIKNQPLQSITEVSSNSKKMTSPEMSSIKKKSSQKGSILSSDHKKLLQMLNDSFQQSTSTVNPNQNLLNQAVNINEYAQSQIEIKSSHGFKKNKYKNKQQTKSIQHQNKSNQHNNTKDLRNGKQYGSLNKSNTYKDFLTESLKKTAYDYHQIKNNQVQQKREKSNKHKPKKRQKDFHKEDHENRSQQKYDQDKYIKKINQNKDIRRKKVKINQKPNYSRDNSKKSNQNNKPIRKIYINSKKNIKKNQQQSSSQETFFQPQTQSQKNKSEYDYRGQQPQQVEIDKQTKEDKVNRARRNIRIDIQNNKNIPIKKRSQRVKPFSSQQKYQQDLRKTISIKKKTGKSKNQKNSNSNKKKNSNSNNKKNSKSNSKRKQNQKRQDNSKNNKNQEKSNRNLRQPQRIFKNKSSSIQNSMDSKSPKNINISKREKSNQKREIKQPHKNQIKINQRRNKIPNSQAIQQQVYRKNKTQNRSSARPRHKQIYNLIGLVRNQQRNPIDARATQIKKIKNVKRVQKTLVQRIRLHPSQRLHFKGMGPEYRLLQVKYQNNSAAETYGETVKYYQSQQDKQGQALKKKAFELMSNEQSTQFWLQNIGDSIAQLQFILYENSDESF